MTTTTRADRLEELLRVYQDALGVVDMAPPVVFVRRNRRAVVRRLRRPRPTWYLRMLVRQHVARAVEALSRAYAARAALNPGDRNLAAERRLLGLFRDALPPTAVRRARIVFVVVVLVLARVATHFTLQDVGTTTKDGKNPIDSVSSLMSPDVKGVGDAVDSLLTASPETLLLASFMLTVSAYVVLRFVLPSFRLKRMILNQGLAPSGGFGGAVTAGATSQTTGTYQLEAAIFRELGRRPLREFPLDLFASLLLLYPVAWLGGLYCWYGVTWDDPLETRVGIALVGVAVARFAWLAWVWLRRSRIWSPSVQGFRLPALQSYVDRPAPGRALAG